MEILIRPKALKFLFCIFETRVSKIGKKKKGGTIQEWICIFTTAECRTRLPENFLFFLYIALDELV